MHRVAVLANGFAWNGKTYPSLSKIAFAITGTRWNGPRFFGFARRNGTRTRNDHKKRVCPCQCPSARLYSGLQAVGAPAWRTGIGGQNGNDARTA